MPSRSSDAERRPGGDGPDAIDRFTGAVALASRAAGVVAALLLLAAVLVVGQMVFVRYVLGASTVWQTEFTTFALIAAVFLGSPYVLLTRGHVAVDLVPLYLGRRARLALALVASGLSLAFCSVMAVLSARLWYEAWEAGWTTDTVWAVPLWKPYLTMAVGLGLLALQYVADVLALLAGRAAPFGPEPGEEAGG